MHLTLTNSWWGAGGIEWSGTNGLRVTEVADDRLTFTPMNSLPASYTVRATAREMANCWDESRVTVLDFG